MIERQELWCHACERYVQFDIDVSLDGQHVITCPNCGHEHYRIIKNGVITEARWGSSNGYIGNTYITYGATTSIISTYNNYIAGNSITSASTQITYGAWINAGSYSGNTGYI